MRPIRALAPLCLLALLGGGCANKEPAPSAGSGGSGTNATASTANGTPIVIGEFASMTGATATFGNSSDAGVQLAVTQINKDGGIDGHPLQVPDEPKDDESKPDSALSVVKKLITQNKVTAVVGEVASSRSIAAAPFCNANKTPMISPSSTNPKVTKIGPYVFRVCFIDPFQGTAAAKFAFNNLKAKKAAVFTDPSQDYSVGLSDAFVAAFEKLGGQIVIRQNYKADDADFRAQLTQIKAVNPDILIVPGYYGELGPIAKQARQIGLTVPLMGGDGWDSPKLVEGAGGPGGALEGCYFTNHSSMDNPDPTIQKFVKDFGAANGGKKPDALAALGYDAIGVLADAMKRAGKPDGDDYASEAYRTKLRDAIAATKGYKGVTGTITLGPNRDAVKPAVVLQIQGDQYKYVATVEP